MGAYNKIVITNDGEAVLASAVAGLDSIQFTKAQLSSDAITPGTEKSVTTLTGVEQTFNDPTANVYDASTVQVSARFANTTIMAPYNIETIGLFGKLTNGSEKLIGIVTATDPDVMPAYDANSPAAYVFNMQLTVSDTSNITLVIDDTGAASVEDVNNMGASLASMINDLQTIRTGTFLSNAWGASAPYIQTISVAGMPSGAHPGWELNTSSLDAPTLEALAEARNAITYFSCASGSVTAVCASDKPAVDLPVYFKGQ